MSVHGGYETALSAILQQESIVVLDRNAAKTVVAKLEKIQKGS